MTTGGGCSTKLIKCDPKFGFVASSYAMFVSRQPGLIEDLDTKYMPFYKSLINGLWGKTNNCQKASINTLFSGFMLGYSRNPDPIVLATLLELFAFYSYVIIRYYKTSSSFDCYYALKMVANGVGGNGDREGGLFNAYAGNPSLLDILQRTLIDNFRFGFGQINCCNKEFRDAILGTSPVTLPPLPGYVI